MAVDKGRGCITFWQRSHLEVHCPCQLGLLFETLRALLWVQFKPGICEKQQLTQGICRGAANSMGLQKQDHDQEEKVEEHRSGLNHVEVLAPVGSYWKWALQRS